MRLYCFACLIAGISTLAVAQQLDFRFSIEETNDYIVVDHLENLYFVLGGRVAKYDSNGNLVGRMGDAFDGEITILDAGNPLRILLYYPGFNQVRMLDNQLAPLGNPVDLTRLGYSNIEALCNSSHGGFWILDQSRMKLLCLNRHNRVIYQSPTFSSLPFKKNGILFIREIQRKIYMVQEDASIVVFDHFGNFEQVWKPDCPGTPRFSMQELVCVFNQDVLIYNLLNGERKTITPSPTPTEPLLYYSGSSIYTGGSSGCKVYSLK
jgi:hypothetical protein